jgi:hypothetical protein
MGVTWARVPFLDHGSWSLRGGFLVDENRQAGSGFCARSSTAMFQRI